MKAVRIIVPEVHDGLGGVHKAGDIAVLPAEVAQIFIEKNCGVEASDVEHAEAIAKAEKAWAEMSKDPTYGSARPEVEAWLAKARGK